MRLQLVGFLLCWVGWSPEVRGEQPRDPSATAATRIHFYTDERLVVISPSASAQTNVDPKTTIGATYAADILSGATPALTSPDVVTAATPFSETRHQAGLSTARTLSPNQSISANYEFSFEPDHTAHSPGVKFTRELLSRRVDFSVSYHFVAEIVGRVDDANFEERAFLHRLDVNWQHILSKVVLFSASATGFASNCNTRIGCDANPYRFVLVQQAEADVPLSERNPSQRLGGAVAGRLSYSLHNNVAMHAGYRWFADTWRVYGHTADFSVAATALRNRLQIRAMSRAATQTSASFFRPAYTSFETNLVPVFRTADPELSELQNVRVGLRLAWSTRISRGLSQWSVVASGARMWMRYPLFPTLRQRNAWISGVGVDATF